jgi:multidrug resistance efflux pump
MMNLNYDAARMEMAEADIKLACVWVDEAEAELAQLRAELAAANARIAEFEAQLAAVSIHGCAMYGAGKSLPAHLLIERLRQRESEVQP